MIDTMYHGHGQTRLLLLQMGEGIEMYHDKQVWGLIEDTHSDSTGALVCVCVLASLVAVRAPCCT